MDDPETCKVSGPLATVLRLSSVLGLAPLRFSLLRDRTRRLRMLSSLREGHTSSHCGYSASVSQKYPYLGPVVITIFLLLQAITALYLKVHENSKVTFKLLLYVVTRTIIVTSMSIATFDGMNRMKRFVSYLNKIEEINNELDSNHLNFKVKKSYAVLWGILTVLLLVFGGFLFFDATAVIKSKYEIKHIIHMVLKMSYVVKQTLQVLVVMQFAFIVCIVNDTLRVLNDRLRNLIYNLRLYDSLKTKPKSNAHIRVRQLCLTHMHIRGLVKSIDKGEGMPVFFLLIIRIIEIINCIYFIVSSISFIETLPYYDVLRYITLMLWSVYKVSSLVLLVEPCHRTLQEFQNSQNLFSRLMCASSERQFRDELSRYHDQFTYDVPVFSPLGICVLTRQLVVVIIGSMTTFLSIVEQFRLD